MLLSEILEMIDNNRIIEIVDASKDIKIYVGSVQLLSSMVDNSLLATTVTRVRRFEGFIKIEICGVLLKLGNVINYVKSLTGIRLTDEFGHLLNKSYRYDYEVIENNEQFLDCFIISINALESYLDICIITDIKRYLNE